MSTSPFTVAMLHILRCQEMKNNKGCAYRLIVKPSITFVTAPSLTHPAQVLLLTAVHETVHS